MKPLGAVNIFLADGGVFSRIRDHSGHASDEVPGPKKGGVLQVAIDPLPAAKGLEPGVGFQP
jgi:hypothetical protein